MHCANCGKRDGWTDGGSYTAELWSDDGELIARVVALSLPAAREVARSGPTTGLNGRLISETDGYYEEYPHDDEPHYGGHANG